MDNPLWQYSLSRYSLPGVEALCLVAQDDYGIDVNLLLLAAWLGEQGLVLTAADVADIDAAVEPWRREVVLPLRALRRQWRGLPAVAGLRDDIKALELRAEQQLQEQLWRYCQSRGFGSWGDGSRGYDSPDNGSQDNGSRVYAGPGAVEPNLLSVLDRSGTGLEGAQSLARDLARALAGPGLHGADGVAPSESE